MSYLSERRGSSPHTNMARVENLRDITTGLTTVVSLTGHVYWTGQQQTHRGFYFLLGAFSLCLCLSAAGARDRVRASLCVSVRTSVRFKRPRADTGYD